MSWSLQLRNGDFTVGGASLGVVTHTNKLLQDIRCAILERMGTDNLHPTYGSLIEGGITPDGRVVQGVIGEVDLDLVLLEVESDLSRIIRQIQKIQLARAKADKMKYGRATLDAGEVVLDLTGIDFKQRQDHLVVTINLLTGSDEEISLTVPIETT
jgi:hypothetical protein